jgi:hypothetical protein
MIRDGEFLQSPVFDKFGEVSDNLVFRKLHQKTSFFSNLGLKLPSMWRKDLSVAQLRRMRKVRRNGGRIVQN